MTMTMRRGEEIAQFFEILTRNLQSFPTIYECHEGLSVHPSLNPVAPSPSGPLATTAPPLGGVEAPGGDGAVDPQRDFFRGLSPPASSALE